MKLCWNKGNHSIAKTQCSFRLRKFKVMAKNKITACLDCTNYLHPATDMIERKATERGHGLITQNPPKSTNCTRHSLPSMASKSRLTRSAPCPNEDRRCRRITLGRARGIHLVAKPNGPSTSQPLKNLEAKSRGFGRFGNTLTKPITAEGRIRQS